MKKILLLLLLIFPVSLMAQAEKNIDSLNYAGIKIAVGYFGVTVPAISVQTVPL